MTRQRLGASIAFEGLIPLVPRSRCILTVALTLTCSALPVGSLTAQAVRGMVLLPDGVTAAPNVVVLLLRAANDSIMARAATSARGTYLLRAPASGEYRLRLLRVGQQPETVGPIGLPDGDPVTRNVVLTNRPIQLARFDVRGKDDCRTRPDSGLLVAQLLSEARKALLASVAASLDGEPTSDYQIYVRSEDARGRLVAPELKRTMTRASARPFNSLPPDSLAKVGYVVQVGDSVVYYGPDAEVLVSDEFAAGHCFGVVEGAGSHDGSMGVVFKPLSARRGKVEIRGTLWMEKETGLLQSVDYVYEPMTSDERSAGVGGEVEFWRTDSGLWIVRRWSIRMPRRVIRPTLGKLGLVAPLETAIDGVQRSGGDAITVKVGDVVHYRRLPAVAVPSITQFAPGDSSRSQPDSPRSTGELPVATTARPLAQPNAPVTGGGRKPDSLNATLRLRVRRDDGRAVPDAEVTARVQSVTRSARSDSAGVAYFIDLPAGIAEVSIRRVGSAARSIRTPIEPGRNELSVQLAGTAVLLDAVRVIGDRDVMPRHSEVDDRILRGEPNAFVTRRDIEKRGPIALSQMLRGMAGLQLADSMGSTVAISTRGKKYIREGVMVPCVMRVMVDGVVLSASNSIDNVMPNDVYAVEVYYGAARVPPQFAGIRTDSWCGLISVWTR